VPSSIRYRNPLPGSFVVDELTERVEAAVLAGLEHRRRQRVRGGRAVPGATRSAVGRRQLGHTVRQADRRDARILDRRTLDPGARRRRLEVLQGVVGLGDDRQVGQRMQRTQLQGAGGPAARSRRHR
jgi:hypothetical protein